MPDIVTNQNFTIGTTVSASVMNNIIPSCVIQPSFVGTKPLVSSLNNGDSLFGLSQGNNLQQILFSALQAQILANSVGASQSGVYNLIINGDGLINQRPLSVSIAATGYTDLDGWKWQMAGETAKDFAGRGGERKAGTASRQQSGSRIPRPPGALAFWEGVGKFCVWVTI